MKRVKEKARSLRSLRLWPQDSRDDRKEEARNPWSARARTAGWDGHEVRPYNGTEQDPSLHKAKDGAPDESGKAGGDCDIRI